MRNEIINKRLGMLTAMLLVVCILISSLAMVAITKPSGNDILDNAPSQEGAENMGNADTYLPYDMASDDALADGAVPGGADVYRKAKYYEADGTTVKSGFTAISNSDQLRTWLQSNPQQPSAFLTQPITGFMAGTNGSHANNLPRSATRVETNSTLDGCGYSISFGYKDSGWPNFVGDDRVTGFFAHSNNGTIKNITFINPTGFGLAIGAKESKATDYRLSIVLGINRGTIDNTRVINNGFYQYHVDSSVYVTDWSAGHFGIYVAQNEATISNSTVENNGDAYVKFKRKGLGGKSYSHTGGIIGTSWGTERNLTLVINSGSSIKGEGDNGDAYFGAVSGEKTGGTSSGIKVSGNGAVPTGNAGIHTGKNSTSDANVFKHAYVENSSTVAGFGVVGANTWSGNQYYNFYNGSQIDIRFSDADVNSVVVVPLNQSGGDILWDVTYRNRKNSGASGMYDNKTQLAQKLIKGPFKMEKFGMMADANYERGLNLELSYGTLAKVANINNQSKVYDGNNHELNMKLAYIDKAGEMTTGYGEAYFNLLYNGADINGGVNANNYTVRLAKINANGDTTRFVYYNDTAKVIATDPDNATGTLSIAQKEIAMDSSKLALNAPSRVYNGERSYNGGVTLKNNSTGVKTETFALKFGTTTYDSAIASVNLGGATKVTIPYELADANKQNYKILSSSAELPATITRMELTATASSFNIGKTSKIYDGTTDFKGVLDAKNLVGANNETVLFTITSRVYNSKYATGPNAANVVMTTIELTADSAINYSLSSSVINVAGTITKNGAVIDENGITISSNVKAYDGTTAFDSSRIAVPNISSYGDTITFTVTSAIYNSKNVADAKNITIAVAMDADSALNYTMMEHQFVKAATITAHVLDINASHITLSGNKTYDGNASYNKSMTFNKVDGVNGEQVTIINAIGRYNNINATGDNAATKVTVTYELAAEFATNYTVIGSVDIATGIDKMNINITADNFIISSLNKKFDGTTVYVGTITQGTIRGANGEELTINTIAAIYDNINASGDNRATKLIITYALDSEWNVNYSANTTLNIAASISKLDVVISADDVTINVDTKVYDGTDSYDKEQVNFAGAGNVGGTPVTVTVSSARYNNKNVADAKHIIVEFALDEASSINFTTDSSQVIKRASITPAELNITADMINLSGNKTYDNTDNYTLPITQTNINGVGGELVILSNLSGRYNSKNVADATVVNVTYTLTDEQSTNYTFNNNVDVSAAINKVDITIGGDSFMLSTATKVYDGNSDYNGTITVNVINGVDNEVITIKSNTARYNNINATGDSAATAIIIEFVLDDEFAANYNANSNVSVTGTITRAQINITNDNLQISSNTKVYDGSKAFDTSRITILNMPSIDGTVVTLDINSASYDSKNTDASEITITFTLDATSSINYTTEGAEFKVGGSITPIALAVTYNNLYQSYRNRDALTSVTVSVDKTNVIAGDTVNATITGLENGLDQAYKHYSIGAQSSNINYVMTGTATFTAGYYYKADDGRNLVSTLADFSMIGSDAIYLTQNYVQTVDFDADYMTISGVRGVFSGNYDGNGMTIKNAMLFNNSLFDTVAVGATITNLALVNSSINNYIDGANVAAIAAINNGTINNVLFTGWVYAVTADGTITNVGTIAAINNGTIINSESIATIAVSAANAVVGGTVAVNNGTITDIMAFNNINVVGSGAVAADIMAIGDGTVTGNYLSGGTYINGAAAVGTTGTAMSYNDIYTANATLFNEITLQNILTTYMNKYSVNLDPTNVIEISNLRDIELVNQYRFLSFKLMNNISFHKKYVHTVFGGGMSGSIAYEGFTITGVASLF